MEVTDLSRLLNPHAIIRKATKLPLFDEIFLQLRTFMPHIILERLHNFHTPMQPLFKGWI
jgi:hypothetical protein